MPFSLSLFIVWFFGRYTSFIRLSIFVARTLAHSFVHFFILLYPGFMLRCYLRFRNFQHQHQHTQENEFFNELLQYVCWCWSLSMCLPFSHRRFFSFPFFPILLRFSIYSKSATHRSAVCARERARRVCIGMNMKDTSMDAMNFVFIKLRNAIENVPSTHTH